MNENADEIIKAVAIKLTEIATMSKTESERMKKAQAVKTSLFNIFDNETAHIIYTLGSKLAVKLSEYNTQKVIEVLETKTVKEIL